MCPIPTAPERPQHGVVSAAADSASAGRFLDFLFASSNNGFVEFRYYGPGRKLKLVDQPVYLPLPLERQRISDEVLCYNGQRMITVGVAPRCRIPRVGRTAKEQDILQVGCIWANINYRGAAGGAVAALERLSKLPLRPSIVVYSGYGYHVYYCVHSPFRQGKLLAWQRMTLKLREVFSGEDRLTLSQVMRLPGTLNIKEAHPEPCVLADEESSWTRYSMEEVQESLARAAQSAQCRQRTSTDAASGTMHPSAFDNAAEQDRLVVVDDEDFMVTDLPPGYTAEADGSVWFHPPTPERARKAPKPIEVSNSPVRIARIREDIDTGLISLVIEFEYMGRGRSTTILRSHLADARRLAVELAAQGAPVNSTNARPLLAYLVAYERHFAAQIPRTRVTSCLGRAAADTTPFLLLRGARAIEFAPAGPGDAALYRAFSSRSGSLPGWLRLMRILADEELLIPQAAVAAAFVPPLQHRLQIPNFILDLYGNTSTGKSTTLKLAASAYGRPQDPDSLLQQWLNTQAAVEQVAGMCSELPIFLDDAQHCPADVKRAIIYMIANGRGKGRGGGGAARGMRQTATWHTVAISTSEEPLHEASPHEGARGRILSVGGLRPPFRPETAPLVQALERAAMLNHGHAGEAYLRHLANTPEAEWLRWQRRYLELRTALLRGTASDVAGRVSGYVAAIQLAAELARRLLKLPFDPETLGAWLTLHLQEQQCDQNLVLQVLRALADFYVAKPAHFAGDGEYETGRRVTLYGAAKRHGYVGFLRSGLDIVFRPRKWNQTAVLNKLVAAGALYVTEGDRHTKKVSVGGVQHRMVCVKWSALFPGDISG